MTKKTLGWFGCALMAGALAMGCGGSKKEAAEPTPPPAENTGTMGGDAYGMGGDAYGAPEGDMGNPCGGAANPCGG
jgi:hypothetical protein